MTNYESRMRAKGGRAARQRAAARDSGGGELLRRNRRLPWWKTGASMRANAIATQIDVHALYGGVVPEIASRMHVEAHRSAAGRGACRRRNMTLDDIDAVAVTYGPGLVGALLTGVSWAKALAYARGSAADTRQPYRGPRERELRGASGSGAALRVSGGLAADTATSCSVNATTAPTNCWAARTDDAAGEAFDKVARVLNIPYPGGPLLDKLADEGDDHAYKFPRPHTRGQIRFLLQRLEDRGHQSGAHICASRALRSTPKDWAASLPAQRGRSAGGQDALPRRLDTGASRVAVAGGVAANSLLRAELARRGEKAGLQVFIPPKRLCTDNAVMIGSAGFYRLMAGELAALDLNALPWLNMFG